jgi:hypothetical protein
MCAALFLWATAAQAALDRRSGRLVSFDILFGFE